MSKDKKDILGGGRSLLNHGSKEGQSVVTGMIGGESKQKLTQLALKVIEAEEQVRKEFSEDGHLALMENIRAQGGVIEPVIVNHRPGENRYLLVAGERRVRATRALAEQYESQGNAELADKFSFIPAIVYEDLSPNQIQEMQLSENLLREDLTELEETNAIVDLLASRLELDPAAVPSALERLEKQSRGAGLKDEEYERQLPVVEELFRSFSSIKWTTFVKKRLHLLKMSDELKRAVREGRITSTEAGLLNQLKDPKLEANMLETVERGMTLEDLREAVRHTKTKPLGVQPPDVQAAVKLRRKLTPKALVGLPQAKRKRVEELVSELQAIMEGNDPVAG